MKKRDLKALAAMGLALGVMMSAQPVEAHEGMLSGETAGTYLAGKCGSKCSSLSLVNYSCGGQTQSQGYSQGRQSCSAQPSQAQGYYNAPSHSCSAQPSQGYTQGQSGYYNAPSHSCNTQPSQGYQQQGQPVQGQNGGQVIYGGVVSHGCGAGKTNAPTSSSSTGYSTQQSGWYTADTAKSPSTSTYQSPSSYQAQSTTPASTYQTPVSGKVQVSDQDMKTNSDYNSLTPEGKAAALKLANQLANQDCKGKNDCAGLSSCKADDHSCAGQNSCKGKGAGTFKDKNLAVKIAAQKVKRSQANGSTKTY